MLWHKSILSVLLAVSFVFMMVAVVSADPGLTIAEVIQLTLEKNPEILLQKETIRSRRGEFTQSEAAFENILTSGLSYKDNLNLLNDANRAAIGGSTFLRQGTTSLQAASTRTGKNGTVMRQSIGISGSESGMAGSKPENRADVKFEMIHPLGRNRGKDSQKNVQRDATLLELDASMAALHATINQSVFQAVQAYWNYSAYCRRLEIFEQARERALRLASQTELLILADERPASERSQIQANLAAKKADCIGAEALVRQGRRNLGLILGIEAHDIDNLALPEPVFPDAQNIAVLAEIEESVVEQIMNQRPDIENLALRIQAAKRRTAGSRNLAKPQVDLNLSAGYSGLNEDNGVSGYVSPLSNHVRGMNFGFAIEMELPRQNRSARGIRLQLESAENSLEISLARTRREIRSGLKQALNLVKDQLRQVACSSEAVAAYQQAIENENEKLTRGISTIVDLLYVEDRLTGAMVTDLQARIDLAQAINSLIYESAQVARNQANHSYLIETDSFLRIPDNFCLKNTADEGQKNDGSEK